MYICNVYVHIYTYTYIYIVYIIYYIYQNTFMVCVRVCTQETHNIAMN